MKILVKYNDKLYLVQSEDGEVDYDWLFSIANEDRYRDYCRDKDWIIGRSQVIAKFTDESNLL